MKKMLKQQVMAALAVTAMLGAAGGMTAQATDTDHILADQKDTINANDGVLSDKSYWYGVVGGTAYADAGLTGTAANIGEAVETVNTNINKPPISWGVDQDIINLVGSVNTALGDVNKVLDKTTPVENTEQVSLTGDTGVKLRAENDNPSVLRYYGVVGGDLSVNTGLSGKMNVESGLLLGEGEKKLLVVSPAETTIVRQGDVENSIGGGSVIGGVGGSAAAALGNMKVELTDYNYPADFPVATADVDVALKGTTHTTIDGNVKTAISGNTNVLGWTNGGLAAGIGGTASSTVTGNTELTIDGTGWTGADMDDSETVSDILNAMNGAGFSAAGVIGGGTAVTTLGGTADAKVGGSTTITVHNANVIGIIGGGAAASVDATGVAEAVISGGTPYGKDEGFVDVTGKQLEELLKNEFKTEVKLPDKLTITATDAIDGGTATSETGDTNISLSGNTTAAGVFGGGAAAAYHTYQLRADKEGVGVAGNEYGSSTAEATTGKSHIIIDLTATTEEGAKTKTTAMGVFGGGAAFAYSETGNGVAEGSGAAATATTNGSEITVIGNEDMADHVGGLLGGGAAVAFNWANATAEMTDAVNITIAGADVSGVAGNGLAYFTGTANKGGSSDTYGLKGTATAKAADTTINVMDKSTVAGILGGGIAIDDSEAATTNAVAETTGKATINVYGGTVKTVDMSDLSSVPYLDGITYAAGDAAIAAGGVALGGGAAANVAEAEVNINGGEVKGDIYGGGIAAYGWEDVGGSHVGTSTINLNGGKVDGDVYAGGAASSTELSGHTGYTHATATVDKAVINLAGTDVTGILSGTGKVSDGDTASATVGESTLNLIGTNNLGLTESSESKIQSFDAVNFKAGSETVVTKADADHALISGGKVTVEDGALLNVNSLSKNVGNTYNIAASTAEGSTFWDNSDLIYDRMSGQYVTGTIGEKDGSYTVNVVAVNSDNANEAADSMAESLGAQGLRGMFREGMNDQWQGLNEGSESYLDAWQLADNKTPYQKGAMIGEDAAVTGNTVSIARDMADNVMQRLSFTDDYVQDAGWVNENGGIWAKYIHRTYDTDAMGSSMGGIHSSTDYDGAIVGVDFGKSGKFQSGVAFHYGSGDGHGLVSRNDYDAWGITMYGSMKDEAAGTNLMADIGWMTSDNDIDGTVEGKSMSADRDVDAWTIGLRGEKEYVFGRNQLVPYVGLRYMSVNPGRYTAYYNGQAAFNYDADNQNLWMLPIGVSFRNETVTAGGWRITPKVDLSYIWAFGDTDTDMTVNAGAYSDSLYYDVMDDSSWLASLGVEASKDVWSFGLGYGYQKGDDEKNRTWFVNASYAF